MVDHRPMILATTNPAKIERLQWMLHGFDLEFRMLADLPGYQPPDETGQSFEENAVLKAVEASGAFGGLAVASDGGAIIPALGEDWNALLTARAAGSGADDVQRLNHLLELMTPHRGEQRRVIWREAVALADRGALVAAWEVEGPPGLLAEEFDPAKLRPGFWLDTIWYYPEVGKLHPDLSDDERNRLRTTWAMLKERAQGFVNEHLDLLDPVPYVPPDPKLRARWEFSR